MRATAIIRRISTHCARSAKTTPAARENRCPKRDGVVDWENTLRVIYQVRCNFFHGGKGPSLNRDRILVSCSFDLLHRLIVSTGLLWRAL